MADKKQTCGSRPITYPDSCTYSCVCPAGSNVCTWTVTCGDWTTSGTGLTMEGHSSMPPHVTLDGNISVFSKTLQEIWQRRVIVPASLRNRKIRKRTLKGTPEEIADALGLKLGAKIRSKPRPKGDYVLIK
jgi:hypothetical protein